MKKKNLITLLLGAFLATAARQIRQKNVVLENAVVPLKSVVLENVAVNRHSRLLLYRLKPFLL
jgi:hypothetical protein